MRGRQQRYDDGDGDGAQPHLADAEPHFAGARSLQGVWVTTLRGSGERVTLTLGATSYQVNRGANQAVGVIGVSGNQINFSNSSECNGTGAYLWSITGTSLSFTVLATDACPGRSEVLAGYTYAKSG